MKKKFEVSRRVFMKIGLVSSAATVVGTGMRPDQVLAALPPEAPRAKTIENFPASPFIVTPFIDPLPQPKAMLKGWRPDPTIPGPQADWTVRRSAFLATPENPTGAGVVVPGPELNQQDVYGRIPAGGVATNGQGETTTLIVDHEGTHQIWPQPNVGPNAANFNRLLNWPAAGIAPDLYHIRMQWGPHRFTTSRVRPLRAGGRALRARDLARLNAARAAAGAAPIVLDAEGTTTLPDSTIWGFNGTFPGPMINGDYGRPAIVRFENDLDKNPLGLDGQNFGAPDLAFLTHQHNGHTAPESDGNPHYMTINEGGYTPGDWVDSMYLGYPAGGDPSEIQTFLWFHDHRMHHTGANVYKGMVGLFPMYDTGIPADAGGIVPGTGLDTGNESDPLPNLGLPGVKTVNLDGTFDVAYDIPLALYDVAFDDGVTKHSDMHTPNFPANFPSAAVPGIEPDVAGATHPEWWGKHFFKHFPNHGFVGDVFTVNCTAYPILNVEPRPYRFRFLGASIARIYEIALMTSANGPVERPGTHGQWQIPDGELWKPWNWIASMGGLLPEVAVSNTMHIWPATRLEFFVDFTGIAPGTEIYLTNVLQMDTGRKPAFNKLGPDDTAKLNRLKYKVPMMKIVVGANVTVPYGGKQFAAGTPLRPMPNVADLVALDGRPSATPVKDAAGVPAAVLATLPQPEFILKRSNRLGIENSWLINDAVFVPDAPLYTVRRNHPEVWTNTNGGGGWVHPMHMHQEEHATIARRGSTLPFHHEDAGRQDVNNLEPGEAITFYRNFRTFEGRYVAHCHNLAHEDHNMMFGFSILPPDAPAAEAGFQVVPRGMKGHKM